MVMFNSDVNVYQKVPAGYKLEFASRFQDIFLPCFHLCLDGPASDLRSHLAPTSFSSLSHG